MKKIFIYITLFACLCLYSCKEKNIQSEIPEISPEYFTEQNYSLSYFSDDIEYIPLDSQVLIGYTRTIEILDSLIFVSTFSPGLLLYNIDGKFIRQIGRKGKGPGEYEYCNFFAINISNQQIYIGNIQNYSV